MIRASDYVTDVRLFHRHPTCRGRLPTPSVLPRPLQFLPGTLQFFPGTLQFFPEPFSSSPEPFSSSRNPSVHVQRGPEGLRRGPGASGGVRPKKSKKWVFPKMSRLDAPGLWGPRGPLGASGGPLGAPGGPLGTSWAPLGPGPYFRPAASRNLMKKM